MASLSAADLKPLVLNKNLKNNNNNNDTAIKSKNNDNKINKYDNNINNNSLSLSITDLRLSRRAGPARAATVVERRNLAVMLILMLTETITRELGW